MKIALISARCERISRCHSLASTLIKLPAVIAIMAAAFLLTGCGKKSEPSSTATNTLSQPTPAQNNNTAASVQNTAAPTQTSQTPEPSGEYAVEPHLTPVVAPGTNAAVAPDLAAMSLAVRVWVNTRHQWPKNFEEWAAAPNYSYPPPPAGKKYAFDKKFHVILVNR